MIFVIIKLPISSGVLERATGQIQESLFDITWQ